MSGLIARAEAAYRRLLRSEVGPADALLPALDAADERARLWAAVLRAARYPLEPGRGAIPSRAAVEPAMRAHPRIGSELAGVLGQLSLILLDADAHATWLELHRELTAESLGLELRQSWSAALAGDLELAPIERLSRRAAEEQRGDVKIEATALMALTALERGEVALATTKARRASRMARTEGAPHGEYLANLVLARLRRVSGRAHLAARILAALAEVAPRPWHGWLGWELILAGSLDEGAALVRGWEATPAASLARVLERARAGDAEGLRGEAEGLRSAVRGVAWMARDAEAVLAAVDPDADLDRCPSPVRAWCRGEVDEPPAGLHGLCSRREEDESVGACVAYVLARPLAPPRRVLSISLPLAVSSEHEAALRQNTRQQGRADTAVAVLTLAGEAGLDDDAFFRATYGFDYVAAQHRGVLDVLKHRMRKQLGGYDRLGRAQERNVLCHDGVVVVPDPRCCQPLSDAVLRALAAGSATAKDLARRLSVPLRTAQLALKQLVEEGACLSTREGRQIRYVLEDTTFSEPTRH